MGFIIVTFLGPLSVLVTEPSKLRCRLTGGKFHDASVSIAGIAAVSPIACPGGSGESVAVTSRDSWPGGLVSMQAVGPERLLWERGSFIGLLSGGMPNLVLNMLDKGQVS